jgi:hypothetical protein
MPKPKSKKKKIDKGEVCGVGQGDIEDTITIVGKISNRISMYSW